MKAIAVLGVVFGLVGCLGAEDIEGELGDEKIGEASGAISGLISPFANNTTYRLTQTQLDGQIRTAGFVFASPGTSPGVDQEQRWVLFQGYSLPLGTVSFEIPGPARRYTDLGAWKSALTTGESPLWRSGASYVKVLAANSPYTPPVYGENCDGPFGCTYNPQLIDRAAIISRIGADGKTVIQGIVDGSPLEKVDDATSQGTNTEVWISKAGYVAELSESAPRLEFEVGEVALLPLLDSFGEGATKTTANCTYFTNLPQDL